MHRLLHSKTVNQDGVDLSSAYIVFIGYLGMLTRINWKHAYISSSKHLQQKGLYQKTSPNKLLQTPLGFQLGPNLLWSYVF